jgi:hypothetical protein
MDGQPPTAAVGPSRQGSSRSVKPGGNWKALKKASNHTRRLPAILPASSNTSSSPPPPFSRILDSRYHNFQHISAKEKEELRQEGPS